MQSLQIPPQQKSYNKCTRTDKETQSQYNPNKIILRQKENQIKRNRSKPNQECANHEFKGKSKFKKKIEKN